MRPPAPEEIDAALVRIAQRLALWGARKVIVHGSVARGDYSGTSDIDIIVVRDTTQRMPQRITEALGCCDEVDPPLPVEPVVYTPAEFARLEAESHPLVTEALRYGRVLYDQA